MYDEVRIRYTNNAASVRYGTGTVRLFIYVVAVELQYVLLLTFLSRELLWTCTITVLVQYLVLTQVERSLEYVYGTGTVQRTSTRLKSNSNT
jgi:hypothetical protein